MAKKSTDSSKDDETKDELDTEVDQDTGDETEEDELDSDAEVDEETDDDSDDSEDEGEEDESEEDEEDSEDFKKRFTQIKGDDPESYLKNLENTYAKSGVEATRLSKENKELKAVVDRIEQAIAKDPKLAEALKGADVDAQRDQTPKNPVLAWAESERDKVWQKEYSDFLDAHEEIATDPELAEALNNQLAVIRDVVWRSEGRVVGMGEGLKKAWKFLDKDDTQEKVRVATKDNASRGKSVSGKKIGTGKAKFTDSQIEMMQNLQGVDRKKALELLTQYN